VPMRHESSRTQPARNSIEREHENES
jgi:hypothetical protein